MCPGSNAVCKIARYEVVDIMQGYQEFAELQKTTGVSIEFPPASQEKTELQ
jgi:hypothetical protein